MVDLRAIKSGNVHAIKKYLEDKIELTNDRLALEIKADTLRQLQGQAQVYKELHKLFS